jgi:quercetin 2,3-dioxygenase
MSTTPADGDSQSLPFEGILPGKPEPFYLGNGEGETSTVFDQIFTILLSGDETDGQYGAFTCEAPKGDMIPPHLHTWAHEIFYVVDGSITVWMNDQKGFEGKRTLKTGDFGFVPLNTVHAFRMEAPTKVFGVNSGGFERFFHAIGTPATEPGIPKVPYITPFPQLLAAGEKFGTVFMPDFPFA